MATLIQEEGAISFQPKRNPSNDSDTMVRVQ